MTRRWIAIGAVLWLAAITAAYGQKPLAPSAMRNHPAIRYQETAPRDAVAMLDARLQSGQTRLTFEPGGAGYLRSVLTALDVPVDSQLLVFSKTSFQASKIGPANPRALYFNDTVSVGFVRGGEVLEFVAQDPTQGAVFYTLEQNPNSAPPKFSRNFSCVQCHTWEATNDVPGMFLGSGFPSANGTLLYAPVYSTDHRTPFDLRWGGWYVTGRHSIPRHMGNALVTGPTIEAMVTPETLRVTSLEGKFDMAGYLSPHSDIVALMVLEHEARMLNLITRVGWEARIGAAAGRPLNDAVEELVDYLLFVDEQPLSGPVTGTSTFSRTFPAGGPRDSQGRSLRELDLQTRLMRYPCSFLIYSEPFNALPDDVKRAIYARMWTVLSGRNTDPRYGALSPQDRQNILAILRETKPDLPGYFGQTPVSP